MTAQITTASFDVYGVPPSMNRNVGRASRHAFTRHKRLWQESFGMALMAALPGQPRPLPALGPVSVDVTLRFTQRRRRDVENFRVLLSKSLGDALTTGRWLADDTAEDWTLNVRIDPDNHAQPSTTVLLAWQVS